MWETYYTPTTLEEAAQYLADHKDGARIIAGGTDLLIELERNTRQGIDTLIDITRIPGLDDVILGDDGLLHIGPLVTQNHIVGSDLCMTHALPLALAAWSEASPQIRNRATVAGNIITASPANDTITPLMALEAQVTLLSVRGTRVVPLSDFYPGIRQTVMEKDEIVSDISFKPLDTASEKGTFIKIGLRKAQAISVINIAIVLSFEGETISDARVTFGSVAPTIIRAPMVEEALVGKPLTEAVINEVAPLALEAATPISDVRSSADYRVEMLKVLTKRGLLSILNGEERLAIPENAPMLWGDNQFKVQAALPESLTHTGHNAIETTINGEAASIEGANHKTLLRMLRENAGLMGTKEGCAEGECGACTVFLDGAAVMSCLVPAPRAHGADLVTIEDLIQDGELHPLQKSFVQYDAVQCGYCTPGIVMAGAKLLEEKQNVSREDVEVALGGNLCRCTGYYSIIDAIRDASQAGD